ncbi:hypothetical protein EGW08_006155 [Elysia chlorotica]|uniref:SCP domain-containing protein n=1 Tax=Elysia chlorotica TaxID=188477 RepID=A0A433TX17_ELYCH|nr:hypothetical protein EGW08_006155 [Elysia chlorotica]
MVVPASCTAEFANRTPKHTMCLQDSDQVLESGVSKKDKKIILDYHNKVRREVKPIATDLALLTWDNQIARVAQKLAKQCAMYHDDGDARIIPGYGLPVGQNVAAGSGDWSRAMLAWSSESKLYQYGKDPNDYLGDGGWKKIGHYTNMVSNRIYRVGCGFARCTNGRFYVCNYIQSQYNMRFPYTNGTKRCSQCDDSCSKGLCDCGGKLCFNKGKLDINTCTCTCTNLYKEADCSRSKAAKCWKCGGMYPQEYCKKYSNIPLECPYMCGTCPVDD